MMETCLPSQVVVNCEKTVVNHFTHVKELKSKLRKHIYHFLVLFVLQVFPNPQQVMSKFVLNIYHNKIKTHIDATLTDKKSTETYLTNLFQLYSQTTKLTAELSQFNSSAVGGSGVTSSSSSSFVDHVFLSNQTKAIFRTYLDSYINIEARFLNDKCTSYLQRYYEGLGHQKVKHNNLIGKLTTFNSKI